MPSWSSDFGSFKDNRLMLVGSATKKATMASDDSHEEDSASIITPECDSPISESVRGAQPALQNGIDGVLFLFSLVSRYGVLRWP